MNIRLFWRTWCRIIEENEKGAAIIVEGKKDYYAVKSLFVRGEIITLNPLGYTKLVDYLEETEINKVIILTDFDKAGELEATILNKLIRSAGIIVLDSLREQLKKSLSVSKIEELKNLMDLLLDGAPLQLFLDKSIGREVIVT